MSKILVIVGTTAVGKSELAVKIAKKYKGEIISADSRQVYKMLNIGTGKITEKEMKGIPHHLIDVVSPKTKFTVTRYQNLANKKIEEILARGHIPILVGGTGFYIDAVTKGVKFPEVKPNLKLRKTLDKKNASELFKYLKTLDKVRAKTIDPHNKVRLIRAIEIAKALGRVPKIAEKKPSYQFIKIGLTVPKDILDEKIKKRVKTMFKAGLINEIKKLKKAGVGEKRLKEFGFEYNTPTEERVVNETLKYVKRQITWFKRDSEIKWFTLNSIEDQVKIISFLEKVGL